MEIVKSTNGIEGLYTDALEHYLSGGGERALRAAYEAGRLALAGEVGLLDMAGLHHAALCKMLTNTPVQAGYRRGSAGSTCLLRHNAVSFNSDDVY